MSVNIQLRHGTAAEWTAANPTLAVGELGLETDTLKIKFGNGATAWNSLAYYASVGAPSGAAGGDLTGTYPNPTIGAAKVTLAQMANLATAKLIGRATAGTGVPEAIDLSAAGRALIDDADAAAQRATLSLGTSAVIDIDTDGTLAANSDAKIATQKAVKTYVGTAVTGLLEFKGSTDCSANPNYPAASKGDAYVVTVAGKIGGASGKSVDVGDMYLATADNAGGTEASVGTSWSVLEHNLVGAYVVGGTDVAVADGGTGASTAAAAATNLGLGTGDSPQHAAVNLGHATDTTVDRASAGDIQVEGNRIFRVGGADVPVADGGTGASTAAAARTNLGINGNWDAVITKAVTESVASSAALQNDDELAVVLAAGVYQIECFILYDSPAGGGTPDLKFAFGEDATARGVFGCLRFNAAGAATEFQIQADQADPGAADTNAATRVVYARGWYVSAGGTFRLKWAQNTSGANATRVLAGSILRYRLIA